LLSHSQPGHRLFLASFLTLIVYTIFAFLLYTTSVSLKPHRTVLQKVAFEIGPALHFGWVLCACTLSTVFTSRLLGGHLLDPYFTSLLLTLPLIISRFIHNDLVMIIVVSWALLGIRASQVMRLSRGEEPASHVVANWCVLLVFACFLDAVWIKIAN
jgi:hypothetical protein